MAAILQGLSIIVQLPGRVTRWDFSIYYLSATALRDGLNPYTADFNALGGQLGLDAGPIGHATDPPTFLLLISPLARIPERAAYDVWLGLNTFLLGAAFILLLGGSSGLTTRGRLAITALVVLYPPLGWHYLFAQSKIPILMLLVLMMRAMERGWNRAAGIFLALAGLLRIFPLLLIVYLALQRRWRVLAWTCVGLGSGGLVTLAIFGIRNSLSFTDGVALTFGHLSQARHIDIAIEAIISRVFWFTMGQQLTPTVDLIRRLTIAGVDAAFLGITIWATFKLKPGDDPDWRGFSLWIVASVLLSPTAWPHYMVLFLIPFSQIIYASIRSRIDSPAQWLALASYSLTVVTLMFMPPPHAIISYLGYRQAYRLYEMALELYGVATIVLYMATLSFTLNATNIDDKTSRTDIPLFRIPTSRHATAG